MSTAVSNLPCPSTCAAVAETAPYGRRRGRRAAEIAAIALAAVTLLVCLGSAVDLSRLHLRAKLNDQVNYVTAARNLVERGKLESSVLYPALLLQQSDRNYLYMPGHAACLALVYWGLGYGVIQSLLPSLIAFVVASIAVFLSAAKLYGRPAAYIAVLLCWLCPLMLFYSITAMAEMTFLAAASVAFCGFLHLGDRWKRRTLPLVIAVPFLFRETAILLLLPACACASWLRRKHVVALVPGVLATVLVVWAMLHSPIGGKRPSMFLANCFGTREAKYNDAIANSQLRWSTTEFVRTKPRKIARDAVMLFRDVPRYPVDAGTSAILVSCAGFALLYGLRVRDSFAVGTGAMVIAAFVLLAACYTPRFEAGARNLLFTYPFVAIAVGGILSRAIGRLPRAAWRMGLLVAIGLCCAVGCVWSVKEAAAAHGKIAAKSPADEAFARALQEFEGGTRPSLVVGPYVTMGSYTIDQFPVRWAPLPANVATFRILLSQYSVDLVVWCDQILPRTDVTVGDLEDLGFCQVGAIRGGDFLVFRPCPTQRPPD